MGVLRRQPGGGSVMAHQTLVESVFPRGRFESQHDVELFECVLVLQDGQDCAEEGKGTEIEERVSAAMPITLKKKKKKKKKKEKKENIHSLLCGDMILRLHSCNLIAYLYILYIFI